jgi:hypothetical protein
VQAQAEACGYQKYLFNCYRVLIFLVGRASGPAFFVPAYLATAFARTPFS